MWILPVIILISLGETFCTECSREPYEVCKLELLSPIPRSLEEFDVQCRSLRDHITCKLDFNEECKKELIERKSQWKEQTETVNYFEVRRQETEAHRKMINYLRNYVDLMEEICNPESHVYKVYIDKLECIFSAFGKVQGSHSPCLLYGDTEEEKHGTIEAARKNMTISYFDMLKDKHGVDDYFWLCVVAMWDIACSSIVISEECGDELLIPGLKYFTIENYLVNMDCRKELIAELPLFTHVLLLVGEQSESIENEIGMK